LGSTELYFEPKTLKGGAYRIDLRSGASVSLFFQTILPLSVFIPGKFLISVIGATETDKSPTIDWVINVFLPYIRPLVKNISLRVIKRGYPPKGKGIVSLQVESKFSSPILNLKDIGNFIRQNLSLERIERGKITAIRGISVAHKFLQERKVAERQRLGALEYIKEKINRRAGILNLYVDAESIGTSITLWIMDDKGNIIGADNLGKKGKLAEIVGKECAEKLLEDYSTGATVDRHLADHLIPLLALAGGKIKIPQYTSHLATNIKVAELFTPTRFRYDKKEKILEAESEAAL
jgi:RNA 3'-phosphate cyclase